MIIGMPGELARSYKSPAQQARVVTEAWGAENLFCPVCDSERLERSTPSREAVDFVCGGCAESFQLKSRATALATKIIDAAYESMRKAIVGGRTPNLFALHYDRPEWQVVDLIVVPRFAYSLSAIEMRKPLASTARRANWVGCNILLGNIPPDARITIVKAGMVASSRAVREQYARLRPLEKIEHDARGWTLDVLNIVRTLKRTEFTLQEVYAFTPHLQKLTPTIAMYATKSVSSCRYCGTWAWWNSWVVGTTRPCRLPAGLGATGYRRGSDEVRAVCAPHRLLRAIVVVGSRWVRETRVRWGKPGTSGPVGSWYTQVSVLGAAG